MSSNENDLLKFFLYLGQAKRTFRTGWVLRGVERVESIADHMYRMALMALFLPNLSDQSKIRCMKLALVHDLAESVVGDLTEFDGISKTDKHRREGEAMLYLTSLLPSDLGREIFSLFNEYSNQQTNESNLVKDLDLFDMLLQAFEYEKLQESEGFLEDFFSGSASKVKSEGVRQWLHQLMSARSSGRPFDLPSDSNLNTILKDILYDQKGKFLYPYPGDELREKSSPYCPKRDPSDQVTTTIEKEETSSEQ